MAEIVIAEDTALQLRLLETYLRVDHDVVGTARDGDEAVWAASVYKPDVVVMDVSMPVKDGVRATADIKSLDIGCNVVISTALVDEATTDRATAAGADHVLKKPYRRDELLTAVDAVLGRD